MAEAFDPENPGPWPSGYMPYAYDVDAAKKLWDLSCEIEGN